MSKKDIIQSKCCECGDYTLCNQKTDLCLNCDEMFNNQVNQLENENNHEMKELLSDLDKQNKNYENDYLIEKLLNELKEFIQERKRLIDISNKMIEEYQDKIKFYEEQVNVKEENIKNQIYSLIDMDKMKDTKTQLSYQLVSGKIIIPKDKYNIKLKVDYDESKIPDKYIKIKRSVDWNEYKKQLIIHDNKVINKDTGEIVENAEIEKIKKQLIELKLWGIE